MKTTWSTCTTIAPIILVAAVPPVSADNQASDDACIEDGNGDITLCVEAHAYVYPNDGHVDGWCRASEADEAGYLECEDSDIPANEDYCEWDITHNGCQVSMPHRTGIASTIKARGCVGVYAHTGPFSSTVLGHVVEVQGTGAEQVACISAEATAPDTD